MDETKLTRRDMLRATAMMSLALAGAPLFSAVEAHAAPKAPQLPYAKGALAPAISQKTLDFHYGKHTLGYYSKLAALISGTKYAKMPLEDIIRSTASNKSTRSIYNNAAQAWNHTFYWQGLKAKGGGMPPDAFGADLMETYSTLAHFQDVFIATAASVFGSGWAWIVKDKAGKIDIIGTQGADTPLTMNKTPLFVVDVWEHAYYLDYQNRRSDYVQAIFYYLANWDVVSKRYNAK